MSNNIVIKRGVNLGELAAEADRDLLEECFFDNGHLDELEDISKPNSIVLGRTGSGKSALLHMLNNRAEHSVYLDPNNISVQFLENTPIVALSGRIRS